MLHLHRSNHVERLVAQLGRTLDTVPLRDPMAREVVAIHSQGMVRWLSQHLSQNVGAGDRQAAGIIANVEWPFPAALARRIVMEVLGESADEADPWAPASLMWSVLHVLPSLLNDKEFAEIRGYLDQARVSDPGASDETLLGGVVDRRSAQLAERIAGMFANYAVYRPDMAKAWGQGELTRGPRANERLPSELRWQPILWAKLCERLKPPAMLERFDEAIRILQQGEEATSSRLSLPERIHIFGLSALPPSFLHVFLAASDTLEVHLYLLCPSPHYWADIRSKREQLRDRAEPVDIEALELKEGNPILASFGRVGRDFQLLLEGTDGTDYVDTGTDLFVEAAAAASAAAESEPPRTMLQTVQHDIAHLVHRGAPGNQADGRAHPSPLEIPVADRSIQFHSCHGPTRQVEVLRDTLLRLLDEDSTLEPRDILVMTPDVETYAPIISAVFSQGRPARKKEDGWGPAGAPELPFHIADRSLRQVNPIADVLMTVVSMARGRVEASSVLGLLASAAVRRRFGLKAEDLPRFERWVQESGIRWGIDAAHRAQQGQPANDANTWRFGLDRLLLGAAMPDEDERIFGNTVPYDDMEGQSVEILGPFVTFCEAVFASIRKLAEPRSLRDWGEALRETMDALTDATETQAWLKRQVRDVLHDLYSSAPKDFDTLVTVDAIIDVLDGAFKVGRASVGHQTGAVTFCAMVPMRSIPFRVIALIGMDDGQFPRNPRGHGFDLMTISDELGDRKTREEDRFLFLEAILSARDTLIFAYTGRDTRTNERRPPAVPLGELLDALNVAFLPESDAEFPSLSEQIVEEHPLQAFSPRNFGVDEDGERCEPRSFDERLAQGAAHLLGARTDPGHLFDQKLPRSKDVEDADNVIDLSNLERFFENPTQQITKARLGIYLDDEVNVTEDRAPVELDALEEWTVRDKLLRAQAEGHDTSAMEATLPRRGDLPAGTPGKVVVEEQLELSKGILEAAREVMTPPAEPVPVDIVVGGRRVIGTLDEVRGDVLVGVRAGSIKPKQELQQWIRQLAASVAQPERAFSSALVGKGDKAPQRFPVIGTNAEERREQASAILGELVDLYVEGQTQALPFFVQTSREYAKRYKVDESLAGDALTEAREKAHEAAVAWTGKPWRDEHSPGESEGDNAYVLQAYGAGCAIENIARDTEFGPVALKVWRPLLDRLEAEKKRKKPAKKASKKRPAKKAPAKGKGKQP